MPISTRSNLMACAAGLLIPTSWASAQTPLVGVSDRSIVNETGVQTTILFLKPEGARVEKGDLVCELDPAPLKGRLSRQEIETEAAEAALKAAQLALEAAEQALKTYVEATYKQELETHKGEVAIAEANLQRARDEYDQAKRGNANEQVLFQKQMALRKARFASEQAQTRLDILEKYTKEKTTKGLQAEVEKAKAATLGKTVTLNESKRKQDELEAGIERCRLLAPAAGLVVRGRIAGVVIERGDPIEPGQELFRILSEDR